MKKPATNAVRAGENWTFGKRKSPVKSFGLGKEKAAGRVPGGLVGGGGEGGLFEADACRLRSRSNTLKRGEPRKRRDARDLLA